MYGIMEKKVIQIRAATLDDAKALVGIINPIVATGAHSALESETVESQQEFMSRFHSRGIFNVAVSLVENRVIGMQTLEPFADYSRAFDHVGIMGTLVELGQRNKCIGTSLFGVTKLEALKRGYEKIFTYVRVDNTNGLNFYRKLGFQEVGTAKNQVKINGKYIDEIIIEMFI